MEKNKKTCEHRWRQLIYLDEGTNVNKAAQFYCIKCLKIETLERNGWTGQVFVKS